MTTRNGVVMSGAVFFVALSTGCGSGASECSEPVFDGSMPSFAGSATMHGTGTLPVGSPDGDALELFLVNQTGSSDLIGPPGSMRIPASCGRTFKYSMRDLAAGTYNFHYRLVPNGSSTPVAAGWSTETFTIADGENLEADPTF